MMLGIAITGNDGSLCAETLCLSAEHPSQFGIRFLQGVSQS